MIGLYFERVGLGRVDRDVRRGIVAAALLKVEVRKIMGERHNHKHQIKNGGYRRTSPKALGLDRRRGMSVLREPDIGCSSEAITDGEQVDKIALPEQPVLLQLKHPSGGGGHCWGTLEEIVGIFHAQRSSGAPCEATLVSGRERESEESSMSLMRRKKSLKSGDWRAACKSSSRMNWSRAVT